MDDREDAMRRRTILPAAAAAALAAAGCASTTNDCDRACLIGVADSYLAALAANDPGQAPLAADIGFVENITRMEPGQGLWASAAGAATDFRITVPDPAAGAVGLMTVIDRRTESGVVPALVAIRLKVENGVIVEAEHVVGEAALVEGEQNLDAPRPALVSEVPADERTSRAALVAIAGTYYDSLDGNDGSLAPFAADCERQENGVVTAASYLEPATFDAVDREGRSPPPVARDCVGQMSSRRFAYIDSIDNRRVFAADPVQGLAMGLSHFHQSMAHGPHLMIAADSAELMWDEAREPYDLPAAHIFKITGGEIHEVEAVGFFTANGSPTGWE
jgi:hypothetical protein